MTPLFEVKTDLLLRQTRRRLPAFSEGQIEIAPIEKGGSDRQVLPRSLCAGTITHLGKIQSRGARKTGTMCASLNFWRNTELPRQKSIFMTRRKG